MSAAVCDIDYSVQRFFQDNWTTSDIHYQGVEFDASNERRANWVAPYVMATTGLPTRSGEYGARVLISVNVYHRESRRKMLRDAQVLEEAVRAHDITIYDDSDGSTVVGYIRLTEPAFHAIREDNNGVHVGTLDVEGLIYFS